MVRMQALYACSDASAPFRNPAAGAGRLLNRPRSAVGRRGGYGLHRAALHHLSGRVGGCRGGCKFIAFAHPDALEQALATVGPLNMQALVEGAGGSWPAPTEEVVRSFWQLLEEADVATFVRMERLTGGAFRSEGNYEEGRLWHLLIPGTQSGGVGVEVRGPNATWQSHADVFFSKVQIADSP